MWKERYDDLWLWPMPDWFVRECNRIGGARVFDTIFLLALGGLACEVFSFRWPWLQWLGYVLLAPVGLLLAMIIITAQVRRLRANTPEARRKAQDERDRVHREFRELEAKVALLRKGEKAHCQKCGGELRLSVKPAGEGVSVKCDKECTHAFWRTWPPGGAT
jgi:hypothetical protein